MKKVNIRFPLHFGAIRGISTSGNHTLFHLPSGPVPALTSHPATATLKIPGKDADFGTQATIKTFYEGKNSSPGHYDWVDTPPKQVRRSQG
jgi:hypothetical protein